jgi:hypothetical protein
MSSPISLLFGVHAHQPVGNFTEVSADAHTRCYITRFCKCSTATRFLPCNAYFRLAARSFDRALAADMDLLRQMGITWAG